MSTLEKLTAAQSTWGNCEVSLTSEAAEGRSAVAFKLGGGLAIYSLCSECGSRAAREGARGIPAVMQDCRVAPNAMRTLRVTVLT